VNLHLEYNGRKKGHLHISRHCEVGEFGVPYLLGSMLGIFTLPVMGTNIGRFV
jgi:hypothetical protein